MKKVKHSLNILVVDDMEINRSLLKSMLEKMCFQVDEAAGGQEAIMMCQSSMYDLILVDINMPGMNGDQVARKFCNKANQAKSSCQLKSKLKVI